MQQFQPDPWQTLTSAQLDALKGSPTADISTKEWTSLYNISSLYHNGYIDDPNLPLAPHLTTTEIHPVFQPQNFVRPGTSDPLPVEIYAVLIPSLRLATRFLTNVHVNTFFSGMLKRPLEPLDTPDTLRRFGHPLRRFRVDTRNSQAEVFARSLEVTKELSKMARYIKWQFGGNHFGSLAMQTRTPIGMRGFSYGSRIYLDRMFWNVLCKRYKSSDCFGAMRNGFDEDAAFLRTQLCFAITLCHEFCHALHAAIHEYPSLKDLPEPYHANDRANELGFAFEQQILSGVTSPIGSHIFSLTCAYGLAIKDFPGADRFADELGSPKRYGVSDQDSYALHMRWVGGFFRDAFWEREVLQYGLERLRAVRRVGWAEHRDLRLHEDEIGLEPLDARGLSSCSVA